MPGKFALSRSEAWLWSFCSDGKVTLVKAEDSVRAGTWQGCIVRLLKCERNRLYLETAAFSTCLSERLLSSSFGAIMVKGYQLMLKICISIAVYKDIYI